jgi:hypothetical protein
MLHRFPIITVTPALTVRTVTDQYGQVGSLAVPDAVDAVRVCRWCYAAPAYGTYETCLQVACITHWQAVRSLDTITWRGE